jgi:putative phosphoserine phosphatase/1-acylglycerol-3-phosphate O-acyltransferase
LLGSVGHPHALNPDPTQAVMALARRWPIEYWDRPPGVPSIAGLEPYHLLRAVLRSPLFPYARFDIGGVDTVPRAGGVIVVANHRSYFDMPTLALVAGQINRPVRFLAKREMFEVGLVGWMLKAIGGIPVDRGSGSGEPLRAAEASLRAGEVVVVLPEGTIPRGEAAFDPVLHGKTGAARLAAATGAPVIPIGLWGTEGVWPRSARFPNVLGIHDVSVRVGPAVPLGYADAVADTEAIMSAIAALLPDEARIVREPSAEELAKTYPPKR